MNPVERTRTLAAAPKTAVDTHERRWGASAAFPASGAPPGSASARFRPKDAAGAGRGRQGGPPPTTEGRRRNNVTAGGDRTRSRAPRMFCVYANGTL